MKKILLNSLLVASMAYSVGALANSCEAKNSPLAPSIPDGRTASLNEMLEARADVSAYVDDKSEYLACVHNYYVKNMMIERIHLVANAFNSEIRQFKRRTAI